SLAARAGLQPGDRFVALDDTRILNIRTYASHLTEHADDSVQLQLLRDGQPLTVEIPPRPDAEEPAELGLQLTTDSKLVYPSPVEQFVEHIHMTLRTLGSLINPQSDIGLSKMSGPVGIIRV